MALPPHETPATDGARILAFCGHCHHFDVNVFGDGGDCHKGHDPLDKTNQGFCADKDLHKHSGAGPRFDMSE